MSPKRKLANREAPLWTCPRCGAKLVTKNLWHSCGRATLDDWKTRIQGWLCESHRLMGLQERLKS